LAVLESITFLFPEWARSKIIEKRGGCSAHQHLILSSSACKFYGNIIAPLSCLNEDSKFLLDCLLLIRFHAAEPSNSFGGAHLSFLARLPFSARPTKRGWILPNF